MFPVKETQSVKDEINIAYNYRKWLKHFNKTATFNS